VKAIYALYSDGHGAQRAVDGLRRAGVPDTDITVISSTPMEDFEFSHINGKNRLWYVACLGGLIGLAGSIALTEYTSVDWPMNVGNMATVAWWAYLVVIFECTMLGAILATVGTLIVTAGLLRRRPALYDPAVSDGKILVGLENPNESRIKELEAALLGVPGGALKTI
jgi:ActD protein